MANRQEIIDNITNTLEKGGLTPVAESMMRKKLKSYQKRVESEMIKK